jgi:Schlafen, AlbA_2
VIVDRTKLLGLAGSAEHETKYVDFKRDFDQQSGEAWCAIVKDIVAFANSGGGIIVFGIEDDATPTVVDVSTVRNCDTADITNKIAKYTGYQFSEIEILDIRRGNKRYPAFLISAVDVPIVFTKPGTYDVGGGKQKTAFAQGTVYFRHGSKSEPAAQDDLARWRDRQISNARKTWLGGIRKVVEAPPGQSVVVTTQVPKGQKPTGPVIHAVITGDAGASQFVPSNAGEIWPHRQKDLLNAVNAKLPKGKSINTHDVQCINRVFNVLRDHPEFAYKPHRLASPQYSDAFVDWIVQQFSADNRFFDETRNKFNVLRS